MNIKDVTDVLAAELTYPIDLASVIELVGDIAIEAPDEDHSEPISAILGPLGEDTYNSVDELRDAINGNVSDEHIGRKFYDDRGANIVDHRTSPTDELDVSF